MLLAAAYGEPLCGSDDGDSVVTMGNGAAGGYWGGGIITITEPRLFPSFWNSIIDVNSCTTGTRSHKQ
ncbi:hypothetical protein E2C01_076333 [Portunus trituberculatus]|uniref:Uncharacterized protein n=1 Tax=Portunus trituberculatus TaxID=210409 RepID=A0A5B7I8H2_PORTR|nr:hypothetical protein [Portunus trituberculatus]